MRVRCLRAERSSPELSGGQRSRWSNRRPNQQKGEKTFLNTGRIEKNASFLRCVRLDSDLQMEILHVKQNSEYNKIRVVLYYQKKVHTENEKCNRFGCLILSSQQNGTGDSRTVRIGNTIGILKVRKKRFFLKFVI